MKPFDMRPAYFVMFAIFSTLMNGSNAQVNTKALVIAETGKFFDAMQRIVPLNVQNQDSFARQFTTCVGFNFNTQTTRRPSAYMGFTYGGPIRMPYQKAARRSRARNQGPYPTPPYSDRKGSIASVMKAPITGRNEVHFKDFEVIRQCAEEVYFEIEQLIPNTLWHRKAFFYKFWLYKNALLNNDNMGIGANHVILFDYLNNNFKSLEFWFFSPAYVWRGAILEIEDFLLKLSILLRNAHGNLNKSFSKCISEKRILPPEANADQNQALLTEKIRECCFETFRANEVTRWMNALHVMVKDTKKRITPNDAQKIFDAMLVLRRNLEDFGMLAFYPPNIGNAMLKINEYLINKFQISHLYEPKYWSLTEY